MFDGIFYQADATFYAEFCHQIFAVCFDSIKADVEMCSHLWSGLFFSDEFEDFFFALGEGSVMSFAGVVFPLFFLLFL